MFCILENYDGLPESIDIYYDEDEGWQAWLERLSKDRFGKTLDSDDFDPETPYWFDGDGNLANPLEGFAQDGKVELRIMEGNYHFPE